MSIRASGISKSFGNRKVLRSLNFEAADGEVVALVGMNGVGKTTLLRILAALMKPDSGQLNIDGMNSTSENMLLRSKVGVVLHASMLYPNLTAEENLLFFFRLYNLPVRPDAINRLLSAVMLEKRGNDLVRTFSSGMQQRLSIARALVHEPTILLMDEPYTGLDQDSCGWLDNLLKESSANGKTILFTTHDLEHSLTVSTRVDILHRGKIALSLQSTHTSPEKLLRAYREVNNAQERTATV